MKIIQDLAAFAGKIIEPGFTCAGDMAVWWDVILRLLGRKGHIYKSISEQAGASNGKLALRWHLNVIVNLQGHIHTASFSSKRGPPRHFSYSCAGKQDVGALQQATGIMEAHREAVIGFET